MVVYEWNSTKLNGKQDLNVLDLFVFSGSIGNMMPTPTCDWLRHFRFLHCNRWNLTSLILTKLTLLAEAIIMMKTIEDIVI